MRLLDAIRTKHAAEIWGCTPNVLRENRYKLRENCGVMWWYSNGTPTGKILWSEPSLLEAKRKRL